MHKSQSTPGTANKENHHASHFGQDQRPLTPYRSSSQTINPRHFKQETKNTHCLQTHVTPPCSKQTNQTPKNNLHRLTSCLLSGGRREPVKNNLYHRRTLIWWKERACISSGIPTFIYLEINQTKSIPLVRCLLQPYASLYRGTGICKCINPANRLLVVLLLTEDWTNDRGKWISSNSGFIEQYVCV